MPSIFGRKGASGGAPGAGLRRADTLSARVLEAFADSNALVSVAVVALGFLVATVILLIIGRNPVGMYQAIVQVVTGFDIRPGRGFWNPRHIGDWIALSSPLILCGLSMAFAFRAGLFNIGAEGQYIAGLTAAQVIALSFPPIPVLHPLAAVLGGAAAGACWGGLVGFFKARYRVSEVVATIMMNHIALFTHRIITLRLPGALPHRTPDFPETARLAVTLDGDAPRFMIDLIDRSLVNHGIWITLLAVFAYWIIMGKTKLGYSLRATGFNRDAAHYGGINVKANITASMGIAGGFAGLAGAVVSLGLFSHGWVLPAFPGYGFEGIAVALVGNSTAWGVALAGLLFGMLRSAQPIMQMRQIPMEITTIIVGLVVVFISLRAGLRLVIDWRMKEKARLERERAEREGSPVAAAESGSKEDA